MVAGPALFGGLLALALLPGPAAATFPPTATINFPINGSAFDANSTILFIANDTSDPDQNSTLDFIWNFSGPVIQGIELRVVAYWNFTIPGIYTVRLTVRDNESLEGYDNVTVNIRPQNRLPVAFIAAPAEGSRFFTTEFINFSGTGSYDPDGEPLTYFWSTNPPTPFGTGENLSVRLGAGLHTVTLTVKDNRSGENSTSIHIRVEVNVPPRLIARDPIPSSGLEADTFTFQAEYFEDNGESAASVLLIIDGTPHPMSWLSGADPVTGQTYESRLSLTAGRHNFYVIASDGQLTNASATLQGPDVWQDITVLSPDGLVVLRARVLPPHNLSLTLWHGPVPVDPSDLLAVSAAYLVGGNFLNATNLTLAVAFAPPAGVNRSSALLFLTPPNGSGWLALVTTVDPAANTASFSSQTLEVPLIYRVYARRTAASPNQPPTAVIAARGQALPNATLEFDASGSTDPENSTLLYSWRFAGPGLQTEWIPGSKARVAFPESGSYHVTLRVDDGSGNVVFQNSVVEVNEPPRTIPPPSDEAAALAALAIAVGVSAVLAMWWRSRTPARKKSYEDLYGRAYKQRFVDEEEYNQLFEKYAEPAGTAEPPPPQE